MKPMLVNRRGTKLDPRGVRGELDLEGNCGARKLHVRVFSPPELCCLVEGTGVLPDTSGASWPEHWVLGRQGRQELLLHVWPCTALLYVPPQASGEESPPPATAGFDVDIEPPAWTSAQSERGTVLGPGKDAAATYKLTLDTTNWPNDVDKTLTIILSTKVPAPIVRPVQLRLRAQGDLKVEPSEKFVLQPPVYDGEKIACPPDSASGPRLADPLPTTEVSIRNSGRDVLRIGPPENKPAPWLEVHVEGPGGANPRVRSSIALDIGDSRRLRLTIDLGKLGHDRRTPGAPLLAQVRFEDLDSDRSWPLDVEIPAVAPPPPLYDPIAIDFGTSNTYAAIVDDRLPDRAGPVLGFPNPEQFPTALCFIDASRQHYRIGTEAVLRGGSRGDSLFRGLKRALARGDATGRHSHSYVDLITKYLDQVLRECQRNSRGIATRVVLSYPANFSPRAIAQLNAVIKKLEETWKTEYTALRDSIQFEELNADEATAVVLGFVLDRAQVDREEGIIARLLREGKNPFYVASFDFGGGSTDLALIRFTLRGDPGDALDYESKFLGIDGNEFFGGDNVTVAVYELLWLRIEAALNPPEAPRRVSIPRASMDESYFLTGEGARWENTRLLWDLAEELKRYLCSPRGDQESRERLENALVPLLNGLQLQELAQNSSRTMRIDDAQRQALEKALRAEVPLGITLEHIYDHAIQEKDFHGTKGYTVRKQIEACVEKLRNFLKRARQRQVAPSKEENAVPEAPDVIVLAGASCRLPLARQMLAAAFPDVAARPAPKPAPAGAPERAQKAARTHYYEDAEHAKSKVAFGLVRYLYLLDRGRGRELKRACDYTHADLVWCEDLWTNRLWVPSCSELDGKEWYPLLHVRFRGCWRPAPDGHRIVEVHRESYPVPELLGWFDLDGPTVAGDPGVEPELPKAPPDVSAKDQPQVFLRLAGAADKARLRIEIEGCKYGDWELRPPPSPARGR
jgi:hypothetical protein